MLKQSLNSWAGSIETITEMENLKPFHIILHSKNSQTVESVQSEVDNSTQIEYRIKVKQWMTKQGSPQFDFMIKYNHNTPMPMREMVGVKCKETKGMVYMKLHGDITREVTQCCMKCGRTITNSVSKFFGMGPECGGHGYVNPFNTQAELNLAVAKYRTQLQNIIWEGWIIKSAIEEEVEL